MNDEKCTGSCHKCSGCGERVVLSCDKEISFVSTITFALRNFNEHNKLCLVTECKKADTTGKSLVKIAFYKDSKKTEGAEIYEITNTELLCQTFEFQGNDADKAEITVSCESGATLEIEHINAVVR